MRDLDQIKKDYENDHNFKKFMKENDSEFAMYVLLSHLDDNLKLMNEEIKRKLK